MRWLLPRLPPGRVVRHALPVPIPWNEIRHNVIRFSRDWTGAQSGLVEIDLLDRVPLGRDLEREDWTIGRGAGIAA